MSVSLPAEGADMNDVQPIQLQNGYSMTYNAGGGWTLRRPDGTALAVLASADVRHLFNAELRAGACW